MAKTRRPIPDSSKGPRGAGELYTVTKGLRWGRRGKEVKRRNIKKKMKKKKMKRQRRRRRRSRKRKKKKRKEEEKEEEEGEV